MPHMHKTKNSLTKENEELRQLLKSFLDGISVNDSVLNSPANPLLVVNQRLQLTLAERRKASAAAAAGGAVGGKGGSAGGGARVAGGGGGGQLGGVLSVQLAGGGGGAW